MVLIIFIQTSLWNESQRFHCSVICGALLLYCNVCKVPPERLRVDYIATYFQKNAQQIWMCASYTGNVSIPHHPIVCSVSYIQSSAIWHIEIVFPEHFVTASSDFSWIFVFVLFCFVLFCFVLFRVCTVYCPENTHFVYHACQTIRFTCSHPRYCEICMPFCSPCIKVQKKFNRSNESRIFLNVTEYSFNAKN